MADIFEIYPNELIEKAAEELKKILEIKPPVWAAFVKTGAHKERVPVKRDWWYLRTAAILRKVYVLGPIGVEKLRTLYGGKKRRGVMPPEFRKGSGSIIRKALQQLEKAGFIKFVEKGVHKGRVITPKGKAFLDKIATAIAAANKPEKDETLNPKEKPTEKREETKKTPKKKEESKKEEKEK